MYKTNFVFGYGSLMNVTNLQRYLGRDLISPQMFEREAKNKSIIEDFTYCGLKDFRRCWNIAMDNRLDLPDYKYYINKKTRIRPQGFITFLNIRSHRNTTIDGILFSVSDRELKQLDRRERNYQRIDVTDKIDLKVQGNVWVYIGLKEAEERYKKGLKQGNVMIAKNYFDAVYKAYLLLGEKALFNYLATTDKPLVPIVNLKKCQV